MSVANRLKMSNVHVSMRKFPDPLLLNTFSNHSEDLAWIFLGLRLDRTLTDLSETSIDFQVRVRV